MTVDPRQRRAARHAQSNEPPARQSRRNTPITVERITDAALEVIGSKGYEAMTMRSVAGILSTGPASLYAHVVNKADIDELVIGRLCAQLELPEPDPLAWREQIVSVCTQLRDQYLSYPGISRAALSIVVTNLDMLRVNEAMLSILLAGGIEPQTAAWAIDSLFLYVSAYALEISLITHRPGQLESEEPKEAWGISRAERDEVVHRFRLLPPGQFPNTSRYAEELTAGTGHERFDFTLGLIVDNLDQSRGSQPGSQSGRSAKR